MTGCTTLAGWQPHTISHHQHTHTPGAHWYPCVGQRTWVKLSHSEHIFTTREEEKKEEEVDRPLMFAVTRTWAEGLPHKRPRGIRPNTRHISFRIFLPSHHKQHFQDTRENTCWTPERTLIPLPDDFHEQLVGVWRTCPLPFIMTISKTAVATQLFNAGRRWRGQLHVGGQFEAGHVGAAVVATPEAAHAVASWAVHCFIPVTEQVKVLTAGPYTALYLSQNR